MVIMKINHYVVGPVQTNCYVVINEKNKECFIIDPGASAKQLAERIRKDGLTPVAVLLTHGHFDHAGAAEELAEEFGIKIYAHEAEKDTLENPQKNVSWMMGASETYHANVFLKDEEVLTLAGFEIKVIHTPGHTEGGCCYYIETEAVIFTGDTLFAQSVGRTDFPGGSMSQIVRSITEKIMTLNEAGNLETDIMVYPGHNDPTTIETERMNNPYL
ncbi:MAG: MBL fold metallo-hydrolase [Lachnospiraceae bacterium]|nr:MBL fold metallo-hydrolase [Agathobacter sp.]MBQ3162939.1 MBL fold metallo-hydrolase [Lachnospiraceae bacterium]